MKVITKRKDNCSMKYNTREFKIMSLKYAVNNYDTNYSVLKKGNSTQKSCIFVLILAHQPQVLVGDNVYK